MPTFPRAVLPRIVEPPKVPTGLRSIGTTGKLQLRSTGQVGRVWEERWPDLRRGLADVEALLAYTEWAYATGQVLDVVHLGLPGSGLAPNGAGGGTPVINGASETGEDIATRGWSTGVTGAVRAGDVLRIAGLNPLYRVVEDADSDGSGNATVKLNPPIPAGSAPSDGAALTTTDCTIRAVIWEYTPPSGSGRAGDFYSGFRILFREAP